MFVAPRIRPFPGLTIAAVIAVAACAQPSEDEDHKGAAPEPAEPSAAPEAASVPASPSAPEAAGGAGDPAASAADPSPADPDDVVVTVDGIEILEKDVEARFIGEVLRQTGGQMPPPEQLAPAASRCATASSRVSSTMLSSIGR